VHPCVSLGAVVIVLCVVLATLYLPELFVQHCYPCSSKGCEERSWVCVLLVPHVRTKICNFLAGMSETLATLKVFLFYFILIVIFYISLLQYFFVIS